MGDNIKKNEVTLVQQYRRQNIRGVRCTKRVSKFLIYCGVYSHQKFYKPPTFLEPAIMPEEKCQDMFARKAYIFQEKTIKI